MLKVEEMSQEQINQEIKRLDSQLSKLTIFAIAFVLGFVTQIVLIAVGQMAFNLISIGILTLCISGLITNINQGRTINLQLFLLNMFKTDEDGK